MTYKVPALVGIQGDMITYQIQIPAKDILTFFGADPRSTNWKNLGENVREIYEKVQRITSKTRISGFKEYVEKRIVNSNRMNAGAFPAVSIGYIQKPKYDEIPGHKGVGYISINTNDFGVIFDGLGRISSLLELLEEAVKYDLPTIPATLFAPKNGILSVAELQQLFYDFNVMASKVTATQARGKDTASPYSQVASYLVKIPAIAPVIQRPKGLNEEKLAKFVRSFVDGVDVSRNITHRANSIIDGSNIEAFKVGFKKLFEGIANKMGKDFASETSVMFYQQAYGALSRALSQLCAGRIDLLTDAQIERLVKATTSIDWDKTNNEWVGTLMAIGPSGDPVALGGAGQNSTTKFINQKITEFVALDSKI